MTDDATNNLAVEISNLKGEVRTSIEHLAGRIGALEQEIKGNLSSRRAEVDGKFSMLADTVARLATEVGVLKHDLKGIDGDHDALADRQRETDHIAEQAATKVEQVQQRLDELHDAHVELGNQFERYLAERAAAREREEELRASSERARRVAAWAVTLAAGVSTVVWTVTQLSG